MTIRVTKRRAIIVPAGTTAADLPRDCRRWLARGDRVPGLPQSDVAERVLAALDLADAAIAPAALRYLGETGRSPQQKVAAADPVHFEAALDHLRAYAVDARDVLAPLFDVLNERLGADGRMKFEAFGNHGYVFTAELECAPVRPVAAIHGAEPGRFMPEGGSAAAYQRLMSEIQMVLHDAAINEVLAEAGQRTVNALWIWGLGERPAPPAGNLPALYSSDPLLVGLWRSSGRECRGAPASFADCDLQADLIAVPDSRGGRGAALIAEARELQQRGELDEIEVRFADGMNVVVKPWHRLRVWRSPPEPPQ